MKRSEIELIDVLFGEDERLAEQNVLLDDLDLA